MPKPTPIPTQPHPAEPSPRRIVEIEVELLKSRNDPNIKRKYDALHTQIARIRERS